MTHSVILFGYCSNYTDSLVEFGFVPNEYQGNYTTMERYTLFNETLNTFNKSHKASNIINIITGNTLPLLLFFSVFIINLQYIPQPLCNTI